jgi:predicted alpha/beta superfamily hydrolase
MFRRILIILLFLLLNNTSAQIQKPSSGKIDLYKNFKSAYVTPRNIEVWLPGGYSKSKKYAVLYMHDGNMLFDSSTTWNKQSWDMDNTAAKLMKNGETEDFIIVGIWNDEATRHIDYFPQKPFESLTPKQIEIATMQKPGAGKEKVVFKPNSDNYLLFIVKELKPLIDSVYSVYGDKNHTFIAGSSMGALISMYAVTEYPEVFGGAACISTHWIGMNNIINNPLPLAFANYLKDSLKKLNGNKLYFDHGDKTLDAFYPPLQKMIDNVMLGYPLALWKSLYFKDKDHSENSWKERVHIPLKFLLEK